MVVGLSAVKTNLQLRYRVITEIKNRSGIGIKGITGITKKILVGAPFDLKVYSQVNSEEWWGRKKQASDDDKSG